MCICQDNSVYDCATVVCVDRRMVETDAPTPVPAPLRSDPRVKRNER